MTIDKPIHKPLRISIRKRVRAVLRNIFSDTINNSINPLRFHGLAASITKERHLQQAIFFKTPRNLVNTAAFRQPRHMNTLFEAHPGNDRFAFGNLIDILRAGMGNT